jgi:hypothetical protein
MKDALMDFLFILSMFVVLSGLIYFFVMASFRTEVTNHGTAPAKAWTNEPCRSISDYLENPKQCSIHEFVSDPFYDGVIYLAEDGTVRW